MTSDYTKTWSKEGDIQYVTVSSGNTLRYLASGSGAPLLLMHTLRTQLDYFQRLVPLLNERFTVYAVDLPGLGWSDIQPQAHYDEPSVRRDIVEFIERLSLDNLTLAGESMGATLALSVAAERETEIRNVVAVNTYDYPQGVERANALASVIIKGMRVPGMGKIVSSLENKQILSGILGGGFYDKEKLPAAFVEELIKSGRRPGYPKVETGYFKSLGSFIEARALYGRIRVPVTLVYGDHDWSTRSERQATKALISGSDLRILEKTGHFASLENPGKVAEIIMES
ncbi:alpha/beta fold hydrolase [Acetobacter conturbans]|uniref:Alpha/beta fold hydrolase n=1 Tax=Acetobacter conturbans TaxID=1737472 RepID=A0ABX0K746_9PROT|nr:alpha/beta hydrolase [Acetobacter conturbans]NHN90035.1 alpha/beta fold hydrolase [Acetobacter conturbans]